MHLIFVRVVWCKKCVILQFSLWRQYFAIPNPFPANFSRVYCMHKNNLCFKRWNNCHLLQNHLFHNWLHLFATKSVSAFYSKLWRSVIWRKFFVVTRVVTRAVKYPLFHLWNQNLFARECFCLNDIQVKVFINLRKKNFVQCVNNNPSNNVNFYCNTTFELFMIF